ncbi:MAG: hypothetical protein SFY66_16065 [Oculatellaceae cyanobacterium bins.114]|nr:hypothetical protein [Oculatellaceae cyanobacterium bins.114]
MERHTRQAKLQQKLAQFHQRQWERSTQALLTTLEILPQECNAFPTDHAFVQDCLQWLEQSFPWQWAQIDWVAVPQSQCRHWTSQESQIAAFTELCQIIQINHLSQHPSPDPTVVVIWFNANTPVLELPWTVVQRTMQCTSVGASSTIFEQDSDTWIMDRQAKWCLECHHEGTLCYGQSTHVTDRASGL